jgi:hypothetical protein
MPNVVYRLMHKISSRRQYTKSLICTLELPLKNKYIVYLDSSLEHRYARFTTAQKENIKRWIHYFIKLVFGLIIAE